MHDNRDIYHASCVNLKNLEKFSKPFQRLETAELPLTSYNTGRIEIKKNVRRITSKVNSFLLTCILSLPNFLMTGNLIVEFPCKQLSRKELRIPQEVARKCEILKVL